MNLGNVMGVAFLSALLAVGSAGCAATTTDGEDEANTSIGDDGDDGAGDEDTDSTSDALKKVSCTASRASGAVPKKHRALLDTIAFAEGTKGHGKDGYNVTFAYRYFSNCARHPNRRICSGRYCSTAAGRYQFLSSTWRGLKYKNFGPANQDRGAMRLVRRRGVHPPASRAMKATQFTNAMYRLSWEWASLPPGRYGQPSHSMAAMRKKYCAYAKC